MKKCFIVLTLSYYVSSTCELTKKKELKEHFLGQVIFDYIIDYYYFKLRKLLT